MKTPKITFILFLFCIRAFGQTQVSSLENVKTAISKKDYKSCLLLINDHFKNGQLTKEYFYYKSLCEFHTNNLDTAILYANRGIAILTKDDTLRKDFLFIKAYAYVDFQQFDKSLAVTDSLIKIDPTKANHYIFKSYVLSYQNNLPQSLEALKHGLKKATSDHHILYNNLAYYSIEVGDYKSAIEYADQGLAITKDSMWTGTLFNNKGFAIGLTESVGKGIELIDKSIRLHPKNSYAYFYKGVLYQKINDQELACNNFFKAKELGAINMTKEWIETYCK